MKLSVSRTPSGDLHLSRAILAILRDAGLEVGVFNPAGGEARQIASVHEGLADLGVGLAEWVRWAYRSEAAYDGWRHTSLRALAVVRQPLWLVVAARWDLRARSLSDLRETPLRVLTYPPSGHSAGWSFLIDEVFAEYGVSFRDIKAAGGRFVDCTADDPGLRRGDVDVVALPSGLVPGAVGRAWAMAAATTDLRVIDVSAGVERVAQRYDLEVRTAPGGGIVDAAGLQALYLPRTVIFASERLEDAAAEQVVTALVDGRERLGDAGFTLDPTRAFQPDIGVRYHRAALSYYKQAGLLPDRAVSPPAAVGALVE